MSNDTHMEIHCPNEVAEIVKSVLKTTVQEHDYNDLLNLGMILSVGVASSSMAAARKRDKKEMAKLVSYILALEAFLNDITDGIPDDILAKGIEKFGAQRKSAQAILDADANAHLGVNDLIDLLSDALFEQKEKND